MFIDTTGINEEFEWFEPEYKDEPETEPKRRGPTMASLIGFWELPENDGTDWHPEGLCYRIGFEDPAQADKWFANPGTHEEKEAVETCFKCPVREQCLKWAVDVKDQHGVYGGINARIRKRLQWNLTDLLNFPNPYEEPKTTSCYHEDKLKPHVERED